MRRIPASIGAIAGNVDAALRSVREVAGTDGVCLVNSVNPDRIAGQTTSAFEIVDELASSREQLVPAATAWVHAQPSDQPTLLAAEFELKIRHVVSLPVFECAPHPCGP